MADNDLFNNSPDKFNGNFSQFLLEQYKIYVEMADRNIERRNKTSTFFLTANSFLLSALGIFSEFGVNSQPNILWLYVASAGGVAFAITWFFVSRSYRQLSSAKFHIINELEKELPASPFTKEWEDLDYGKNWKKYTKLTRIEICVPSTFVGLYIALGIVSYLF